MAKLEKLFTFIQTQDNGFLLAGLANRQSGATGKEVIVIKTDTEGKVSWHDLIFKYNILRYRSTATN